MTEFADIEITEHKLPLGRRYYTFKWNSKPTALIQLSYWLQESEMWKHFPWPIEFVEESPWNRSNIYVKKDGKLWFYAKLISFLYTLKRFCLPIYCRLILTAMIWELSYVPEGEVPSWKHLGKKNEIYNRTN